MGFVRCCQLTILDESDTFSGFNYQITKIPLENFSLTDFTMIKITIFRTKNLN